MERTTGRVLARRVTLVPILRAGLGMAEGVLRLLPDARLGHLGVYRDEKTLEPVSYYQKLPPDIADDGSAADRSDARHRRQRYGGGGVSKKSGVTSMKFVCLVAAPAGIEAFHQQHPEVDLLCRHRPGAERKGIYPPRPGRRGGPNLWDLKKKLLVAGCQLPVDDRNRIFLTGN
jgi:hypothetical protein